MEYSQPTFGLANLIGGKGIDTLVCRMTSEYTSTTGVTFPQVNTLTITRSPTDDVTTTLDYVSGSGFGFSEAQNQLNDLRNGPASSLNVCPDNVTTSLGGGAFISTTGEQVSRENTDSGVYEFLGMASAIAVIAIAIVLANRGIFVARRTVKAVVEETNDDDNLEYYENPHNGQVYWRIKKKAFR